MTPNHQPAGKSAHYPLQRAIGGDATLARGFDVAMRSVAQVDSALV
ncbi:MAG: hypothetical protein LBH14_09435 [Desulfobulbaceae bacterium]|jgi:hypothetical protein|nr:hypothetical protein [Desulfobulbaceae bacterium]